jgi:HD-GYP domain-containing protein (c-di-GMP phosphodiesterase class II)
MDLCVKKIRARDVRWKCFLHPSIPPDNAIIQAGRRHHIHNYRVTIYAIRLAEAVGLKKECIAGLIKGSLLHDVGKIAISDLILLKPGKLTEEEMSSSSTGIFPWAFRRAFPAERLLPE